MDDALMADEMFTVLMGDKVEPRRRFIERYARQVRNLTFREVKANDEFYPWQNFAATY